MVGEQVADLPLAVAARGADVLRDRRVRAVGERVENLLQLLAARDLRPPVREAAAAHDREAAAAAAAVVVHAVRVISRNCGQMRRRISRCGSTMPISRTMLQGSWSVTGKSLRDGSSDRRPLTTMSRRTVRKLSRGIAQVAGEQAVGDDEQRLVGVAALADDDLLHLELPRRLGVPQRHPRELRVVVPEAVVDRVVAGEVGRHRPGDAGGVQDDAERAGVLRPGEDLARVVDQQDVGALDVPRRLDREAGLLRHLLVDELDVVLDGRRVHAGRRAGLELQHRAGGVQLLGRDAHLLAEQLADLVGDQAVVHADAGRSARSGGTGCSGRRARRAARRAASSARRCRAARPRRGRRPSRAGSTAAGGSRSGRSGDTARRRRWPRRCGRRRSRSGTSRSAPP